MRLYNSVATPTTVHINRLSFIKGMGFRRACNRPFQDRVEEKDVLKAHISWIVRGYQYQQ
jgi:hypothetical protein